MIAPIRAARLAILPLPLLALTPAAIAAAPAAPVIAPPPTPAIVQDADANADRVGAAGGVRTVIAPGTGDVPAPPQAVMVEPKRGTIALNFPNADVRVVARAVLGDLLHLPYTVAEGVAAPISLVTPGPVARSAVLGLFETALRGANLALVPVAGGYEIQTTASAQGNGPVGDSAIGFGSEVITLQFINSDEVRKVIDSVMPGVITATNPALNTVTIAGTTGQRESARALLKEFDVNWLRNVSFALFVPQRTDSRLIVPELEKLINASDSPTRGLVRLITMERLNGILAITAQRQYLEDVRRWIDILDREGQSTEPRLFVYRVQNGRARDLARTLTAAFGSSGGASLATENADPFARPPQPDQRNAATGATPPGGQVAGSGMTGPASGPPAGSGAATPGRDALAATRITADEVNNAVIVYGTPREYATVEEALRQLDIPPYQVLIEAAITEVTLTDALRYGVQWNFLTGNSNFSLSEGATAAPVRTFPGFSYFYSNNNDISATLNALEQRTNLKVVSAPKILVLNNQTAALQVGDQVPVSTGSAVSVDNANAPIVNSIEYRDTGVILKVTPRVNSGGLVLLDISQEVSDVNTNASSNTTVTSNSPTISTRRISTSVAVQDGQVIALGGLFRNSQSFGKNGVPILSRIPVLGGLFGNHVNDQTRTELIVLLKPHVLRTIDDGRAITDELRAKLRTLEPFRTGGRIP